MTEFKEAHERAVEAAWLHSRNSRSDDVPFIAYLRAMEKEGYRLLPRKATAKMIQAGDRAILPEEHWFAMFEAAESVDKMLEGE